MAMLYPNLCYNEICYEETVLYIENEIRSLFKIEKKRYLFVFC